MNDIIKTTTLNSTTTFPPNIPKLFCASHCDRSLQQDPAGLSIDINIIMYLSDVYKVLNNEFI